MRIALTGFLAIEIVNLLNAPLCNLIYLFKETDSLGEGMCVGNCHKYQVKEAEFDTVRTDEYAMEKEDRKRSAS